MLSEMKVNMELKKLAKILNVKESDNMAWIARKITKEMSEDKFFHVLDFIINNHEKRSFPMWSDFKRSANTFHEDKKKPEEWQIEYAHKLGIPIDQFVNMRSTDLSKEQRMFIDIMEPEEVKSLFNGIYKTLNGN